MLSFKINEISAVDNPAQSHARIVLAKRKDPEMQTTDESAVAMDTLLARAEEIRTQERCSRTVAMSKARDEMPEAREACRFVKAERDEPICGVLRKSADELEFENIAQQIAKAERIPLTHATQKARRRYPDMFERAYG
jgi:hypothetical protein